mmetsp:Transcript_9365/g.15803  ORF Transcript_9365/g.15803 Transcript_9365/m.15803 type:complete len:128 (+) Transcript_9365:143-526(+)|eukprot:CAMPEP_0168612314 /NCGR_PEP_ID=MMETSP0449_2-20121227/2849_1 /TAXON_ID=1082188 /ORGANISM="Strombidium rassoulzadegani, Strain ras09" /LENGTH=127 /DNA_ID=CAMNT_0008652867 /DNA_START=131 /DNA_END=514 /DNA_ORIENTATION=+
MLAKDGGKGDLEEIKESECEETICTSYSGGGRISSQGSQVENSMVSNSVSSSKSETQIKKMTFSNNLFLDIDCLTKNMQTLLKNFEMYIIAEVTKVTVHKVPKGQQEARDPLANPFGLGEEDTFFKC